MKYRGKKLSLSFVKDAFASEGYTLLEDKYFNSYTKMKFICPVGHMHKIIWNNWNSGVRCPYCSKTIKYTYDDVKKSFEENGYTLVSKKYKNSFSKLNYICSRGHSGSIRWHAWNILEQRCKKCYNEDRTISFSLIKDSFESEGYKLLSKTYSSDQKSLLNYVCPLGHKHRILWLHWQRGVRCPICFYINNSGPNHHAWCGGVSFEPYCAVWKDKEYKDSIKERDGCRCLNPYCCSKNPYDLVIHHIDYNKKNCRPNNLITICRSCNNKANFNRDWHKSWYQALLVKRYNYK